MKATSKTIKDCRACGTKLISFFSLGDMPLVNSFLKKEEIESEEKYDLSVGFCPGCSLAQLFTTISPKDIFEHYAYLSSVSAPFVEHCRKTAKYLIERLGLTKKSLFLEIASNDGAQLQFFKEAGIGILGIDPAKNIAAIANKKGLKTVPEFFNHKLAKKLSAEGVSADVIYGGNVLAHVPEIVDFVKGVSTLLAPKGTALFEFPYVQGLFENKFDTIYHEHVFYYSLVALKQLFAQVGIDIYDVEMNEMQGGSLRIFLCHKGAFEIGERVVALLERELEEEWDKLHPYQEIAKNVESLKKDLRAVLDDIKSKGKTIAAYSAPAKGNILLNYFGIDSKYIDYIVDITPTKQHLYTPGTYLLVHPEDKMKESPTDYILVLCWNAADYIVKKFSDYHARGGKFIIPVPQVKII